ncbi:MAG TPA: hypothetical protein GXZ90_09105 [Clostridiales bacterium]|nr:hypothetical protein [Clostridiales bacterium]
MKIKNKIILLISLSLLSLCLFKLINYSIINADVTIEVVINKSLNFISKIIN